MSDEFELLMEQLKDSPPSTFGESFSWENSNQTRNPPAEADDIESRILGDYRSLPSSSSVVIMGNTTDAGETAGTIGGQGHPRFRSTRLRSREGEKKNPLREYIFAIGLVSIIIIINIIIYYFSSRSADNTILSSMTDKKECLNPGE